MKLISVKLNDVYVDLDNPRFHPKDNEKEQMTEIIHAAKILPLCSDIAEYGLDPSENILASYDKESKIYRVKEGNRRITALKILNNPQSIPNAVNNRDSLISKIKVIKQKFNYRNIESLSIMVSDDENKLNHFILLKHTGVNQGAGRVGWDIEAVTRFTKKPFENLLLEIVTDLTESKGEFINFSTIRDRIITDPDLRDFFDITIDRSKPSITFNTPIGKERFIHVLQGLMDKTYTVGNFHSKQDRITFIENYLSSNESGDKPNPVDVKPEVFNYDDKKTDSPPTTTNDKKEDSETPKIPAINENDEKNPLKLDTAPLPETPNNLGRPRKTPAEYDTLIPAYHFKNRYRSNKRINQIVKELSALEYKQFPIASMFLLRAILECYTNEYIDYFAGLLHVDPLKMKGINKNRAQRSKELRLLLYDDIYNHLKDVIQDHAATYELIHTTFTTNNNTSTLQIINYHIHSGTDYPDVSEMLEAWKKISQIVNSLDEILYQNTGQIQ